MISLLLVGYNREDLTIDSLSSDFIPPQSSVRAADCYHYSHPGYIKLFTSDRVIGIYQIECGDRLIIQKAKNGAFVVKTDISKRYNEPVPIHPYACFRSFEGALFYFIVFSLVVVFLFAVVLISFLIALTISRKKVWDFISVGNFRKKFLYLSCYFLFTLSISFLSSFALIESGFAKSSNTVRQLSEIVMLNTVIVEKIEKAYGE